MSRNFREASHQMKILFLNNNFEGNGTYWRCFGLAKYLVKFGNRVTLFCIQKTGFFKMSKKLIEGVDVVCLPKFYSASGVIGLPGHVLRSMIIVFYILTRDFDICHVFNVAFPTSGLSSFFAWFFKTLGIKKYKLIVDWDDLWGLEGLTHISRQGILVERMAEFLETKIPLLADKVTVVSDELRNRAILAGVKPEKIFKIINGANIDSVKPINKKEARKKTGVGNRGKIVCYPARQTLSLEFVLSSFKKVAREINKVKLLLVNPLNDQQRELVVKLKLEDKVVVVGFKPYNEYLMYLAAADVLLLPRSSHILDKCEFPARLGDFMASERPIVTNQSGDAWKIIKENEAGLVANVDDPNDFAIKVVQILNNPKLAQKFARNGRKAAEEKYSWEKLAKELDRDVYGKNLNGES